MNIAIVGLGSMGRRRIRLLKEINSDYRLIGIDTNTSRCEQVADEFQIPTYTDMRTAICNYDVSVVVVSCDPEAHYRVIHDALEKGCHVFSEINIVSLDTEQLLKIAYKENRVLFLSSTMLYRKEVIYIKEKVEKSSLKFSYCYHVGQYLPDWHPWEKYQDFFVGKKNTNACREIMAIEFPWIINTFGEISRVYTMANKMTSLEIEYPDTVSIILEHENGNMGTIMIDVVSRSSTRRLELISEKIHLVWDGTPKGIKEYNFHKKQFDVIELYQEYEVISRNNSTIIENAYKDELINFFNVISGIEKPRYSFEEDAVIIETINEIERNYMNEY